MAIQLPDPNSLPIFATPPVVETVLSAQFFPLEHFSNAHAGWFWKNYLGTEWGGIKQVSLLNDQFERFDDTKSWGLSNSLRIFTESQAERHQIVRDDKARMIQVQPSRFIYNWKKVGNDSAYPSYRTLQPEFFEYYNLFDKFAAESGNPALKANQWEVTYVNQLVKGDLWDSVEDWTNIFPWLSAPATGVMQQVPDGFKGDWRLVIGEKYGRLHVSIQHVRIGSESGPEAIILQITARGPIDEERSIDLEKGFDIGHSSIVLSFENMTSAVAHETWT